MSFVFLIITIVLLSTQLTITIVWRNQRAASPPKAEQTICEPCSELYRDGELPAGCEIKTEDKGDKQCCCDASVAIDRIVENVSVSGCVFLCGVFMSIATGA